jgi:Flp pilus assembly protein TadD
MGKAARKDSNFQSAFAVMARRFNMPKLAEDTAGVAKKTLSEKVRGPEATEQDFFQLCLLQLTDDETEAALETARKGLATQGAESQRLKHLASEALRILYRKSIQHSESGIDLKLTLLDEAMRLCPSNPNLATEIALLGELGIAAPPAFKAALQQQLLNGQATALAHLILANEELRAGRLSDAIPHLELSLRQAPNHPVTLNNLALALARTRAEQLKRAEHLIAQAISINPRNPEYYDTQGEILLLAKRPLDAVESLEKAITIERDRRQTRELMVKAYRAAGMEDLAAQQEKMLATTKPPSAEPES